MAKDLGLGITISLRDNLSSGAKKAGDAVGALGNQGEKSVGALNKMQRALNAAAGSALLMAGKRGMEELIKSSTDFERKMAEISTLVDTSTVDMKALGSAVDATSKKYGVDAVDAAAGLYEILSADIGDTSSSLKAFEVANQLAIGGVTETKTAVDGLTSIINAWKLSTDDSTKIADTLFTTVKLGKVNMEELSRNIADVAPYAAQLGINLEEVGASMVVMTKQGTRAPIAFTQMKAAIVGMLRPTSDLERVWKRAGFANATAAIKARGYHGALEMVVKAAKGNEGQIIKLLGSTEAASAAFQVTGQNSKMFAKALNDVNNSAGATETAVGKMMDSNAKKIDQANAAWQSIKRTVGSSMLTALEPLLKKLNELALAASVWIEKNPKWATAIGLVVAGMAALAVVLGVLSVAMFIFEVVSSPVILIILAIIVVLGLVVFAIWYFRDELIAAWNFIKPYVMQQIGYWKTFGSWIATAFSWAVEAVKSWASTTIESFKAIWDWISKLIDKYTEFVGMIPLVGSLADRVAGFVGGESTVQVNQPKPWQAIEQAQSNLLSVKNPSANGSAPIQVQNTVNVPKTVVNPASVQIDKREIAKVMFDVQQQEGVRQ